MDSYDYQLPHTYPDGKVNYVLQRKNFECVLLKHYVHGSNKVWKSYCILGKFSPVLFLPSGYWGNLKLGEYNPL